MKSLLTRSGCLIIISTMLIGSPTAQELEASQFSLENIPTVVRADGPYLFSGDGVPIVVFVIIGTEDDKGFVSAITCNTRHISVLMKELQPVNAICPEPRVFSPVIGYIDDADVQLITTSAMDGGQPMTATYEIKDVALGEGYAALSAMSDHWKFGVLEQLKGGMLDVSPNAIGYVDANGENVIAVLEKYKYESLMGGIKIDLKDADSQLLQEWIHFKDE